jgi:LPXTG-motif cell wall-anchored protein
VTGSPAGATAVALAETGGMSALPVLLLAMVLLAAGASALVSRRRSA